MKQRQNLPLNQRGYIGMAVIAFLIVLSMILYPWPAPESFGEECSVGEAPDGYETIQSASVIDPDPTTQTEYVLIRKNVGVGAGFDTHVQLVTENIKPGYDLYVSDPEMSKQTEINTYYPREEGLVFLVNNDPSVKMMAKWIDENGEDRGEQVVRFADVYQDKKIYDSTASGLRDYIDPAEMFECYIVEQGSTFNSITVPSQDVSPLKDQLQLEWFLMDQGNVWGVN